MKIIENVKRRHFLIGSAGTMVAAAVGAPGMAQSDGEPLPDYVAWKDAEDMIVHSKQTLETKRAAQGSELITPSTELYIRNNLPAPPDEIVADRDAWEVEIDGVANPGKMTVGEMKTLAVETVVCVLQCSGNGRAFFDHETSGSQWSVGAAGNVVWTGVPVRAVIDAMGGANAGAVFLTGTGGEEIPEGLPPETIQVERSVPKAAMDQAILAWEMNGEPLPLAHGGPLRLVIPGYYGVNNVKYLKRLAMTAEESPNKIQQTSYRVRPVRSLSAVDVRDGRQILDHRPSDGCGDRQGAGPRRRHGRCQRSGQDRGVHRRGAKLGRSAVPWPGPWPLCMAAIRADHGAVRRHTYAGEPCHQRSGRYPTRVFSAQRTGLWQ